MNKSWFLILLYNEGWHELFLNAVSPHPIWIDWDSKIDSVFQTLQISFNRLFSREIHNVLVFFVVFVYPNPVSECHKPSCGGSSSETRCCPSETSTNHPAISSTGLDAWFEWSRLIYRHARVWGLRSNSVCTLGDIGCYRRLPASLVLVLRNFLCLWSFLAFLRYCSLQVCNAWRALTARCSPKAYLQPNHQSCPDQWSRYKPSQITIVFCV